LKPNRDFLRSCVEHRRSKCPIERNPFCKLRCRADAFVIKVLHRSGGVFPDGPDAQPAPRRGRLYVQNLISLKLVNTDQPRRIQGCILHRIIALSAAIIGDREPAMLSPNAGNMLDAQNQSPQCTACSPRVKLTAIKPSFWGKDLRTYAFSQCKSVQRHIVESTTTEAWTEAWTDAWSEP
jgi:hypothetical protein